MFRYSLLTLFGAILVIAVGCAALVSASDAWATVVVMATVLALLIATIGAIYLPARARAFAGGFAIFGWAYLLLAQGPWFESLKPQLATTVALNKLQGVMHEEEESLISVRVASAGLRFLALNSQPSAPNTGGWAAIASAGSTNTVANFHQIGQSLWAILLACVGGVLARAFGNRRSQPVADGAGA